MSAAPRVAAISRSRTTGLRSRSTAIEQPIAARESMPRALAHDPGACGAEGGGDRAAAICSSCPTGEIFYYLGLAAEVEGRDGRRRGGVPRVRRRACRAGRWARAAGAPRRKPDAAANRRAPGGGGRRAARGRARNRAEPRAGSPRRSSMPPGGISAGLLDACLEGCASRGTTLLAGDRARHRRARQDHARRREGAAAVRRAVCALRGVGDQAATARPGARPPGRTTVRTELIIGIHQAR